MAFLETPRTQRIETVTAENHSTALVGTFGNVNISRGQTLFDSLPFAANAEFDSSTKQDDSPCLPDTRTEVLKSIRAWAYSDEASCIFWLSGKAGTGKSTIALTIARDFNNRNELGASFFFARGGGDAAHAGKFFTSVARQLAIKQPAIQSHIAEALRKEPDIATKTRQDQWEKLIVEPLNKTDLQSSMLIIVVDALDECNREEDIIGIIGLFAKAPEIKKFRLRILVTSRPETAIRGEFRSPEIHHRPLVLENQPRNIVDADICLYYYDAFEKIKRRKPRIPRSWPDIDTVNQLICSTGGLFIFAATVYRFVNWSRTPVDTSIQAFLCNGVSTTFSTSHDEFESMWALDRIYTYILGQSIPHFPQSDSQMETITEFQDVLGAIAALAEPLGVSALACLLAKPEDSIYDHLEELYSVVCVPEKAHEPIRLFHTSFRDFLLNPKRCRATHFIDRKEIHIPISLQRQQIHNMLAMACLRFLSEPGQLHRDMCSVGKPGTPRGNITDDAIRNFIPPTTAYACRYWVYHVEQSGNGERIKDSDLIQKFLGEHFLHWIETLSWLGYGSECINQISTLQLLTEENSHLAGFLYEAGRFLVRNLFIVDHDPLQLYCSALVFSPQQSMFRRQFAGELLIQYTGKLHIPEAWGSEIRTLEGQPQTAHSLAFSSDGQLIASVSRELNQTSHVMVWSAVTDQLVRYLQIHDFISEIVFSSEKLLVVVFQDGIEMQIWDVSTGQKIQQVQQLGYDDYWKIKGHLCCLELAAYMTYMSNDESTLLLNIMTGEQLKTFEPPNTVMAISHDGQTIASGCAEDGIVQLWSVKSGQLEEKLHWHVNEYICVALSPDGQMMAVFYEDGSVGLFNTATGKQSWQVRGHKHAVKIGTFSYDGKLLVTGSINGILVWSTRTGELLNLFDSHSWGVRAIAISPNGCLIASASDDHMVRVWNLETDGRAHNTVSDGSHLKSGGTQHVVTAVAFSPPNGDLVTSAARDGIVQIWDSATGLLLRKLAVQHTGFVTSVAFAPPDGCRIATSSTDGTIRIWETASGKEKLKLKHSAFGSYNFIAFSPPDRQLLASGSEHGVLTIWDLETQARVLHMYEGWSAFTALAFSTTNGQLLATADSYGEVILWNVETGRRMKSFSVPDCIRWMAFSSDGDWLETDTGQLNLTSGETSTSSLMPVKHRVRLHGRWVRLDGRDILWLPLEYSAECVAIHEDAIAMGHQNGMVSIIRFLPLE